MRITLREAKKFHGHIGPYLILGILAGELALKKLKCEKYFGLDVKVYGANRKPKSCLIDGLQLSTGTTYGKGNIRKFYSSLFKIEFYNNLSKRRVILKLNKDLVKKLEETKTHRASAILAKALYKINPIKVFNLQLTT